MINLHAQRQQVLRTNEKFMRDARARFNDTKRILIEKDLKKWYNLSNKMVCLLDRGIGHWSGQCVNLFNENKG